MSWDSSQNPLRIVQTPFFGVFFYHQKQDEVEVLRVNKTNNCK